MISLKDYEAENASRRDFYRQFVTVSIKQDVQRQIGLRPITESLDPYFDDIPYSEWCVMPATPAMREAFEATGGTLTTSHVTRIYKEAACQLRAEYAKPRRHTINTRFQGMSETLTTQVNGTVDSIMDYFMKDGGRINLGQWGEDRIAKVASVKFMK